MDLGEIYRIHGSRRWSIKEEDIFSVLYCSWGLIKDVYVHSIVLAFYRQKWWKIKMRSNQSFSYRTQERESWQNLNMNDTSVNDTSSGAEETGVDPRHLEILMAVVPIVVPIIFTLVIIIGFVGNLLVVLVVILNKKMRNTTNILIFNLAVSSSFILLILILPTWTDLASLF